MPRPLCAAAPSGPSQGGSSWQGLEPSEGQHWTGERVVWGTFPCRKALLLMAAMLEHSAVIVMAAQDVTDVPCRRYKTGKQGRQMDGLGTFTCRNKWEQRGNSRQLGG